jgi:hypothetical protein
MREFKFGSQPDRATTTGALGNDVCVVDAEIDLFIYDLGEPEGFGGVEPGVVNKTLGWIIFLYLWSVFDVARRR